MLSILAGLTVTIYGLLQQPWPKVIPWVDNAFWRYASLVFVFSVALVFFVRMLRMATLFAAIALGIMVAVLTNTTWSLFVVCWFALASVLLGKRINTIRKIDDHADQWSVSFLIGAGMLGTLVGVLAHFPVNYVAVYAVILLAPIVFCWRELPNVFAAIRAGAFNSPIPRRLDWLVTAMAAIALSHFVAALMPEVMFDALTLHLFVPSQIASRHEWGFDPSLYAMALIPMIGDWLFSIVYMFGGESAARLLNVGFTYLLIWQGYKLVMWAGGTRRGAHWMALLFLSSPIVFTETSSLFVESVWSVFIMQGVLALVCQTPETGRSDIRGAGLMLGFAAATKAVTLSVLPALLPFAVLYGRIRANLYSMRSVGAGLLLFLSVGAVPYVTAWAISGNPVFPFFNAIFESPYFPAVNFDNLLYHSGASWDLAYRVAFSSGRYLEASNGAGGFQWLILLPAALVVLFWTQNKKAILLFLIASIAITLVFYSQSYLRYVYPAILMLTVVIGTALSKFPGQSVVIVRSFGLATLLAVGLNLLFLTSGTWAYRDFPIAILFDKVAYQRYVEMRAPTRPSVQLVNLLNTEQAPVAFFSQPFGAGLQADALYPNWYNYEFKEKIDKVKDAESLANVLNEYGVNYVLLEEQWGESKLRDSIAQATRVIAQFGSVEVRAIRDEYRYEKEKLTNPELTGTAGWTLSSGAKANLDKGTFLVSVDAPAVQTVGVRGGTRYMLEVTSRCSGEPAQGRSQVNWYDENHEFIDVSIKVFECTPHWQARNEIVIAPRAAKFASVYATSHTTTPIEISGISFR